jgi:ornithine--oxo-acid transaminase
VTIASGEGAWVEDTRGVRHLDLIAAYSALNFGHRHPRLVAAAHRQLDRITLTSRAVATEELPRFCAALAELAGKETVLVANTGAEAVESAIKAARRWAYRVKGVPADRATIIVCDGNFHGRTTTLVGCSTDPQARADFGPFTPGFVTVPYGDLEAIAAAVGDTTAAVLVEPIQGEAGVIVPPDGYLAGLRALCDEHRVLFVADEVQSGLGRTGATFACDHEDVRPDVYVLGKALGGGIVPLSAVVADWDVLGLFEPGSHGSTFGGNPLACAVGLEVLAMLREGGYQERAAELGATFLADLSGLVGHGVVAVRGRGLWAGIELAPDMPSPRQVCEHLLARRLLVKEAHGRSLRLAPPLVIDDADLAWAVGEITTAQRELHDRP